MGIEIRMCPCCGGDMFAGRIGNGVYIWQCEDCGWIEDDEQ